MPQLITYIKQSYATLLTSYLYYDLCITTHSTTQWTQPSILQLSPELSI